MVCDRDPSLSRTARTLIEDPSNERLLSIASPWEMAIKLGTGKLKLTEPLDQFLTDQLSLNLIGLLPITVAHVAMLVKLPLHHRDPFDRLIVGQAMVEHLEVLSIDSELDQYSISRRW